MLNRRDFLQSASLVSLAPFVPTFLPRSLQGAERDPAGRILVVIQLDGGNDGINTVVPFKDEEYARARSALRIDQRDLLKLNESLGLNPGMKSAVELLESRRLAIVQGVGYPNPNRSHFESLAIWQHARLDSAQHDSIGWLGRTCDFHRTANSADSFYLGREAVPVALRGRRSQAIAMDSEADLQLLAPPLPSDGSSTDAVDVAAFIERTLNDSYRAAKRFEETAPARGRPSTIYPASRLARHLELISRMIKLGGGTRIFYTLQSGYDTHDAQLFPHRQLLNDFSNSLRAFLDDLRESSLADRIVVLAFSEFGRRVRENDSAGTDHGAAGPVFLAGAPVQSGIIGKHPSLIDLDDGDLKMQYDFRQIYATLLERWLAVDPIPILGNEFQLLPLIG
jgi:uncharacterized protein (DUF1501 family)